MISAIVLAKDEGQQIDACLSSLSFCEELIVVDNGSRDNTVERARDRGARILDFSVQQGFSTMRNRAMKQARGDWVLFIDADERVSEALQQSIIRAVENDSTDSYALKRRDHWWGKTLTHGEVATAAQTGLVRLMKRNSGQWEGSVHERFVPTGAVGILEGYIEHYPHQTVLEFIVEINQYSSLRAQELHNQDRKSVV